VLGWLNCLQKFDISQKKGEQEKNQSEPRKNTLEKVEKMGKAYSKTTLNCQWQSAGFGFGGGGNGKRRGGRPRWPGRHIVFTGPPHTVVELHACL